MLDLLSQLSPQLIAALIIAIILVPSAIFLILRARSDYNDHF